MTAASHLLTPLKQKGYRASKTRTALVDALIAHGSPLAAAALHTALRKRGVIADKTTVYREIGVLVQEKIAREVHFSDNKRRYEIADEHHHHVICIDCDTVEDVILPDDMAHEEHVISKKTNFTIMHHTVEFYGRCGACTSR